MVIIIILVVVFLSKLSMKIKAFTAGMLLSLTYSAIGTAKEHTVKLLTVDDNRQTMIMEPSYIRISKGDVVNFVTSDTTHNAQSLILPEGAKPFTTELGKSQKVAFSVEGAYLYKCTPHFALGMLGVIQVGRVKNLNKLYAEWESVKENVVLNKVRVENAIKQIQ